MLSLQSEKLTLEMRDDGTEVFVEDRRQNIRWRLDEATRLVSRDVGRHDQAAYSADVAGKPGSKVGLLGPGKARRIAQDTILAVHDSPSGRTWLRWVMKPDRLEIFADIGENDLVTGLALPGTFRPTGAALFRMAIPNGQGVLHSGRGPAFYRPRWGMGTDGFTMAMFGQITDRGALLSIAESDADAVLHWEKTPAGDVLLMWRQEPCFGKLSYPRQVILFPTAPDLTSLCKTYRNYEIEQRRFVTWDEKIAARPKLARLFGSAIVFLGYAQDVELDYAAAFRNLKAAGIDKAYVHPVYYCMNLPENRAEVPPNVAFPWADQRRLLPMLHEMGYLAGSFIYISDGPAGRGKDAQSGLVLDRDGQPIVYWEMEGMQWFKYASEKRLACAAAALDCEHQGLDGVHFDTLCCGPLIEDYHPSHRGGADADRTGRQAVLDCAAAKGMIVSAEGFWGRMTGHYDLCSTKYGHVLGGDEYCIVPMTMLVYHDCACHSWWELDNYDNPEHLNQYGRGYLPRFPWGGGAARRQAAIDALMGTLPDIFPFGLQYNFIPHSKKLYFYRRRFEDPLTQEAIAYVKPVMALNARIGKLAMVEHQLHRPNGALQETVFANGTRVMANFANIPLEMPEGGLLAAESWVAVEK